MTVDGRSLMSCVWAHFPDRFPPYIWTVWSAHSDFLGWRVCACLYRCSLPSALLAEWSGSFMCHCSSVGKHCDFPRFFLKDWHLRSITLVTCCKHYSCSFTVFAEHRTAISVALSACVLSCTRISERRRERTRETRGDGGGEALSVITHTYTKRTHKTA